MHSQNDIETRTKAEKKKTFFNTNQLMECKHWNLFTVNSPVIASKPTWTVCSKFVGYDMFGFKSFEFFGVVLFAFVLADFFFLSSSGSANKAIQSQIGQVGEDDSVGPTLGQRLQVDWRGALAAVMLVKTYQERVDDSCSANIGYRTFTSIRRSQTHRRRWRLIFVARHFYRIPSYLVPKSPFATQANQLHGTRKRMSICQKRNLVR